MHGGERRPRGGAAAVALHQLAGLVARCGPCRGGRRSRATAPARARSPPGSRRRGRARRRCGPTGAARRSAAGRRSDPLRPMNSSRSAGHRAVDAVGGVDVEEGDPVAEVVAVAVAGVERAVVGRDLGVDMRRGLLAQVAEHPFDVAGGGEARGGAGCRCAAPGARTSPHRRARRIPSARCAPPPRRARTRCSRSRGGCGTAVRPRRRAGRPRPAARSATRPGRCPRRAGRSPRRRCRTPGRCARA